MALPRSGALTLRDIAAEFDPQYSASKAYKFSEFYAGGSYVPAGAESNPAAGSPAAIPSSGAMKISDFYGASAGATRQRVFYIRRADGAPAPPSLATFAAWAGPAGWSIAALAADDARGLNVYKVTLTQTFSAAPLNASNFESNAWSAVTLHDLSDLVVTISGPAEATVGQTVTLTANVRGGEGPISYLWSGDAAGAGRTSTVTRSRRGDEDATVTVTRGTQTASDDHEVEFSAETWSPALPAASTICAGISRTVRQTSSLGRTRTVTVTGTKPWSSWSAWSPAVSAVCAGIEFEQTRTRTCTSGGQTHTQKETQDATGTKPWGAWSDPPWTPAAPAASSLCEGVKRTVTQRRVRVRTCTSLGQTHRQTDPQTRTVAVTGTKDCSNYPAPVFTEYTVEESGRGQIAITAAWTTAAGARRNGAAIQPHHLCGRSDWPGLETDVCGYDPSGSFTDRRGFPPGTHTISTSVRAVFGSADGPVSVTTTVSRTVTIDSGEQP
ncbi:MAG: hypothetical protein OXH27_02060 [Gammaproteobacteria bacterium]|nr:hypothetical protein [Gammaproteobacteria bacterium]